MTSRTTRHGPRDDITRRDFVGGALVGAGGVLLSMASPSVLFAQQSERQPYQLLGPDWTGPGGIGDYARSNGNTHQVVNDAHSIRDGYWKGRLSDATDVGSYDLVVVGGGFSGLMASYTFQKGGTGSCLVIDNHPIFGGEAKQNEIEVDGYHLYAPQGSNGFGWPPSEGSTAYRLWQDLQIPIDGLQWQREPANAAKPLLVADDSYQAMYLDWKEAHTGFFYRRPGTAGYEMVRDPWANGFRDAPIDERAKRELMTARHFQLREPVKDWERWLDGITYKQFLQEVVGITRQEVFDFIDPMMAAHGPGLGSDVISAYAAVMFGQPGVAGVESAPGYPEPARRPTGGGFVNFPGGNAGIARHFVKRMTPDAIPGDSLADILYGPINWSALDRPGQRVRFRLGSTAIDVRHGAQDRVVITFVNDGTLYRVNASRVVMAGGQWINKHVLGDAPDELRAAMGQFHHAPMLVINVALTNWRFMERAGITAARWFDGFSWFTNLRAPLIVDGKHAPLDPGKPTVLTFYTPFTQGITHSGLPIDQQAIAARTRLFSMPYAEIEQKITQQLTELFSPYGFDASKDIAAIITNRWGHAYVVPQPGFFYGKDGQVPFRDVVRAGYGRIRLGHSELTGDQMWYTAAEEGERAAHQAMDLN